MAQWRTPTTGEFLNGNALGDVPVWNGSEWLPGAFPPPPPPPPVTPDRLVQLPVNSAGVDRHYQDGTIVLRTGSPINPAGAFNGGGVGNKAIAGLSGYSGLPLGSLLSIDFDWQNVLGPTGQIVPPPGPNPTSVTVPFLNLIVDFDPTLPGGNVRVCSLCDAQLAPAISNAIGTYVPGLTGCSVHWQSTETFPGLNGHILIVNSPFIPPPPGPTRDTPGGVLPNVTVGPLWTENAFRIADLLAGNPGAILIDAFTANPNAMQGGVPAPIVGGDGGLPAGARTPAILLVSGDSSNVVKSGKQIISWFVNGTPIVP